MNIFLEILLGILTILTIGFLLLGTIPGGLWLLWEERRLTLKNPRSKKTQLLRGAVIALVIMEATILILSQGSLDRLLNKLDLLPNLFLLPVIFFFFLRDMEKRLKSLPEKQKKVEKKHLLWRLRGVFYGVFCIEIAIIAFPIIAGLLMLLLHFLGWSLGSLGV